MVKLIPESYVNSLDLSQVFGRVAPLEVDLGCAECSFLLALAERHPERNYLGIERMAGRVAKACRRASKVDNLRILHLETSYAVCYLLPPESVDTFYLLFPDPWPKRRHQRRRVFSHDFLQSIHRALVPTGILQIATDQPDYFQQMQELARDSGFEGTEANTQGLPTTKFERIFREKGAPIYRLSLRKTSPVK